MDKGAKPVQATPTQSSENLLAMVEDLLNKEKAEDIVTVALAGKTSIADHMVIATGRSTRQVSAMAEKLVVQIKAEGFGVPRIEGKETADWVLIDAGDVIVHLFRPEVREFYQIEKIWVEGAGLDLDIKKLHHEHLDTVEPEDEVEE